MKRFIGAKKDYNKSNIIVIGIPFDATSSFRSGSRFAPNSIRLFSDSIETYSPYFDKDIENILFFDYGNVEITINNFNILRNKLKNLISKFLKDEKKVIALGGEHLITLPIVEAYIKKYPDLIVIQLDAHTDLRDTYFNEKFSHATVMRRIYELVGNNRIFQFGIRSGTKSEFDFANKYTNLNIFSLNVKKTLDKLKNFPIYLTLDLDVLDPSVLPGTGNPEPGGFNFRDLVEFLKNLYNLNIVGVDVVELSPDYDYSGVSSITAAKLVRELLILLNS